MRSECRMLIAGVAIVCGTAGISYSQSSGEATSNHRSSITVVLKGMPYSATRIVTTIQIGPDGKSVTHIMKSLLWRDADGRTRQEDIQETPGVGETRAVNVDDPVAHVHFAWNAGDRLVKEVMVTHLPVPEHEESVWPDSSSVVKISRPSTPEESPAGTRQADPNVRVEILQPTYISGVYVTGTRTTRVIPAGKEGNDTEIRVISESWKSPDLKLTVLSTRDDPRTGRVKVELTQINRANPDLTLFQAPDGYKQQDVTNVFYPTQEKK